MLRVVVSPRLGIVGLVTLAACNCGKPSESSRRSPVETAIARDLTARFGTSVTVVCTHAGAVPLSCAGKLADGTEIPLVIENASKREWGWRIDGMVIESKTIALHVQAELAALQVQQTATCGLSWLVISAGERVPCTLSGGGTAFVEVAADGSTQLEIVLDRASAAARSELVTPQRDRELTERSTALELLEGESDGEEAVPIDGGVPKPSLR